MSPYLFVAAAALAVIPMLIVFKRNLEKIKENPDVQPKAQQNFFIGAAISEALPLVLIVLGLMNLGEGFSGDVFLPIAIIAILIGFSAFFILLQKSVGVPEEAKAQTTAFSMIALAMVNAIPIISIVSLIIMMS